jgi:large subunit ribosomal protein L21
MSYAIVKTGGKQYRVEKGQSLLVERLHVDDGANVELEPLLYVDGSDVVDADGLSQVTVQARVVGHERGPKLRIVKFKPKRGYKRRTGHRQELTRLEVTDITLAARRKRAAAKKAPAAEEAVAPVAEEAVAPVAEEAVAPVAEEAVAPVAEEAAVATGASEAAASATGASEAGATASAPEASESAPDGTATAEDTTAEDADTATAEDADTTTAEDTTAEDADTPTPESSNGS